MIDGVVVVAVGLVGRLQRVGHRPDDEDLVVAARLDVDGLVVGAGDVAVVVNQQVAADAMAVGERSVKVQNTNTVSP